MAHSNLDCVGCAKASKCCDFQPFVPNYLLGQALARGVAMTFDGEHLWQPIGLVPSAAYKARHATTAPESRGSDFDCVFFKDRLCTIWPERPGECRTYFCEGRTAADIEQSEALFAQETRLAQHALIEQGWSLEHVHMQIDVLNDGVGVTSFKPEDLKDIYRRAWEYVKSQALEMKSGFEATTI